MCDTLTIATLGHVDNRQLLALSLARRLAGSGEARAIRQSAGLSLKDVADAVGSTPSGVWRWERGERGPRGLPGVAYGDLLRDLQRAAAA